MAPLNDDACTRYLELFTRAFGVMEEDLIKGDLSAMEEKKQ